MERPESDLSSVEAPARFSRVLLAVGAALVAVNLSLLLYALNDGGFGALMMARYGLSVIEVVAVAISLAILYSTVRDRPRSAVHLEALILIGLGATGAAIVYFWIKSMGFSGC